MAGGIRYDNPEVKLDKNQATYSQDRLVLVSRGSISTVGDTGVGKKAVRDASCTLIDYEQYLKTVNNSYKTYYAGKYAPADFAYRPDDADWGCNIIMPATYGVYVGNMLDCGSNKLSAEGVIVTEGTRKYMNGYDFTEWNNFPTHPPLVSPCQHALLPVRFRSGNINAEGGLALKGSMSSIGKPMCSSAAVPTRFDYSLQSMKPEDIKAMGLPLTVIPCSWQRN